MELTYLLTLIILESRLYQEPFFLHLTMPFNYLLYYLLGILKYISYKLLTWKIQNVEFNIPTD